MLETHEKGERDLYSDNTKRIYTLRITLEN